MTPAATYLAHCDKTQAPTVNDGFLMGWPIQWSVLLEQSIEAHPEIEPAQWWDMISSEGFDPAYIQNVVDTIKNSQYTKVIP